MNSSDLVSPALSTIAEMVTPALLLLASASLVASALVRMARIVDRSRVLSSMTREHNLDRIGITVAEMNQWLRSHAARARFTAQSIFCLYVAIALFVLTTLSIVLVRVVGASINWLPLVLAVCGSLCLFVGAALLVAECRLSGEQIASEIHHALKELEDGGSSLALRQPEGEFTAHGWRD